MRHHYFSHLDSVCSFGTFRLFLCKHGQLDVCGERLVIVLKKNAVNNPFVGIPGMGTMRCPYCRSPVVLRSADGIYKENHANTMLYVCSRYPACDAYVRVHEGTNKPVGSLADHRLRKLRKEAHDSFNKLYLTGAMTKDQAYAWLAHMIQGPRSQAHIGYLREYYCEQVIQQSKAILANRKEAQQAVSQTRRQLRAGGETV